MHEQKLNDLRSELPGTIKEKVQKKYRELKNYIYEDGSDDPSVIKAREDYQNVFLGIITNRINRCRIKVSIHNDEKSSKKYVKQWKKTNLVHHILLSHNNSYWTAYLIINDSKELEQQVISVDSPISQALKNLTKESIKKFDARKLIPVLTENPLFEQEYPALTADLSSEIIKHIYPTQ